MQKSIPWQTLLRLAAGALGAWLFFRFLGPVLLPFALGLLPALAAQKATVQLQDRIRVPRWLSACLCVGLLYLVFFLVLFLAGRLLLQELESFLRSLPQLAGSLAGPLSRLEQAMLELASRFPDGIGAALEQWTQEFFRSGAGLGQRLYSLAFSLASGFLKKAPDIALFCLTALLSGFMLAAKLPNLQALWTEKAPKPWQEKGRFLLEKLKGTLLGWLKAQGKLMLVTFLVLTAGFLLLGVEYPLLFGVAIALVDALPVLGSGLFLIPWSMVQFLAGNTFLGVGLLCVYAAAALLRTALEPRLLGKQMGLDPLLTLLCLYAGFRFFGVPGMILFPMALMFGKQVLH